MINNLLLEDELKRIGFIMNYDSKKLVSENIETTKNLIVENKIETLFTPKTNNEIISETTLKKVFKEVWDSRHNLIVEQWVKGTDQVFYWKVLFDQLTKGGIGVKWEVANDPVKSTFMYWGPWVINKDVNKHGGWPITFTGADKKLWPFKFQGGKYAGQPISNIIIESKFINSTFNLGQWGKVDGAKGGSQFANLMKTKPKSATTSAACKTVDGKPIAANQIPTVAAQIFKELAYAFDGAGTYEGEAVAAYKKITCKPILDAVNAKVAARGMSGIKNVGDWAKDEMSDYDFNQYRQIWANLQKLGYKAPPVNYAMATAGVVGKYATPLGAIEALGEGAKKAYDKLMNMSAEDIMEGFREIVSGVAGTIGTLILSLIPGGQAVNVLIYGVLTAWDVIQLSKGSPKFSWFNLILDVFSLALSGIGLAKALKPAEAIKPAVAEAKTLPSLFQALETKFPKIYKLLKGFVDTVGKGAKFVVDGIEKGIAWLIQKLPFLAKFGNMLRGALQKMSGLIGQIVAAAEKTVVGNVVKTGVVKLGQKSAELLARGTAYMATKGPLIGAQIVKGLESKIGTAVAQELDKKVLEKIEAYAFENGTKTIEQLRPGICAMGKNYCNAFDISMNAINIGKDVKDLYKAGSGTLETSKELSGTKDFTQTLEKSLELAKSGTETTQKGIEKGDKLTKNLTDTGQKTASIAQNITPLNVNFRPDLGKV